MLNVVFISGDVHFPFALPDDPSRQGSPLMHEVGCTPFVSLCLPPAAPDQTLNPTILFSSGAFGADNHNFGNLVVDKEGDLTVNIHTADGAVVYTLQLPNPARPQAERNGADAPP